MCTKTPFISFHFSALLKQHIFSMWKPPSMRLHYCGVPQEQPAWSCGLLLLITAQQCRQNEKWNESGFRPPLCTYRLNWARRTSWGWWDDWDDTVLQTQDSKFEPWRSEAEHATSRSQRLPTILTFTRGWGRNNFVSFKPPRPGTEPRTLAWKAAVLTTTLGPPPSSVDKYHFRDNLNLRLFSRFEYCNSLIIILIIRCCLCLVIQ